MFYYSIDVLIRLSILELLMFYCLLGWPSSGSTNALSFYRSQNFLDGSKFFLSDQKFIYILWQSQTFCARQKDDLHSVKL